MESGRKTYRNTIFQHVENKILPNKESRYKKLFARNIYLAECCKFRKGQSKKLRAFKTVGKCAQKLSFVQAWQILLLFQKTVLP